MRAIYSRTRFGPAVVEGRDIIFSLVFFGIMGKIQSGYVFHCYKKMRKYLVVVSGFERRQLFGPSLWGRSHLYLLI